MAFCVNTKSAEFQSLKERTNLSDFSLIKEIVYSMNHFGRYPKLDEIRGANSEQSIKKELKIASLSDMYSKEKILKNLNSQSAEEAQIRANNIYLDKEMQIIDLGDLVYLHVKDRPNKDINTDDTKIPISKKTIPDLKFFQDTIYKLNTVYGNNFKIISNKELASAEWLNKVPNGQELNAFIYNGEIYLNVDNMKIDSPIHELLHLFLGSIKYSNNNLYLNLVNKVEELDNYNDEILKYPNRTKEDINEEIFVTEFAKYMAGETSYLSKLDEGALHEIKYSIDRTLDSVIFGKNSVVKLNLKDIMGKSIKDLSKILQSDKLNLEAAFISRTLNNRKQELLKSNKLKEVCI